MENRFESGCNCLSSTVTISAEEYRHLIDTHTRNEIVKSILSDSDSCYMDVRTIRQILGVRVEEQP